ncbi:MAG TPA: lysophospholipid acyltransferase family protein [Halanaerobiales bacterium]|nr:lysophospholipid acyltransferase family protein [Halanaerobiales bacterium]
MSSFNDAFTKFKNWFIPKFIYGLIVLTNKTINLRVIGEKNTNNIDENEPLLYAFWHGYMWIPVYYYRNRQYFALSSLSQDGEYMTRILRYFGWQVIRGSSTRGGSKSVLKLYKKLLKGNTTVLTPDGPTGPIYKVKPGIIYLQEKSEGTIIPLGIAIDKKIEVNSWDKFNIPLPFTKTVLKIGEPVNFKKEKSIEKRCQLLEERINSVQQSAEEELAAWKGKVK